jgi:hypothetical protein
MITLFHRHPCRRTNPTCSCHYYICSYRRHIKKVRNAVVVGLFSSSYWLLLFWCLVSDCTIRKGSAATGPLHCTWTWTVWLLWHVLRGSESPATKWSPPFLGCFGDTIFFPTFIPHDILSSESSSGKQLVPCCPVADCNNRWARSK